MENPKVKVSKGYRARLRGKLESKVRRRESLMGLLRLTQHTA